MNFEPTVSVCVCTFRRPHLLTALLGSLAAQTFPLNRFEVVVVDNDKNGSGRSAVIDAQRRWSELNIRYEIEPQVGISYARNRSVSLANGRYLAFVDDDESTCPQWLEDLIETILLNDADAVLGPVLPVFPAGSKDWVKRSKFFDRPRYQTNTVLGEDDGRAGNALVLAQKVNQRGCEVFAARFALSGGEDHDFFRWMVRQGGKLVWCDTATVQEEVPLVRQTLSFMLERSFRSASTYWRGQYSEHNSTWAIVKAGQGFVGGILYLLYGVLCMPTGLARAVPLLCKSIRAFARIGALLNMSLAHYGK